VVTLRQILRIEGWKRVQRIAGAKTQRLIRPRHRQRAFHHRKTRPLIRDPRDSHNPRASQKKLGLAVQGFYLLSAQSKEINVVDPAGDARYDHRRPSLRRLEFYGKNQRRSTLQESGETKNPRISTARRHGRQIVPKH